MSDHEPKHFLAAAAVLANAFTLGTRASEFGTLGVVVILKPDAPEWCRDAVREAHEGAPPCDWCFVAAADAATAIHEAADYAEDLGEAAHAWADGRVIYYRDNAAWYAHAANARAYLAEVDAGALRAGGVDEAVAVAHYTHALAVWEHMVTACRERADALAEAEAEAEHAASLDALAPEHEAAERAEVARLEAAQARDDADEAAHNAAAFALDPHRMNASPEAVAARLAAQEGGEA